MGVGKRRVRGLESLASAESTGVERSDNPESALRVARHNLRGRLNALKLCVSALEILTDPKEELEFVGMIDQAADATVVALDHLEAVVDQTPSQSNI
jgi:hypothetical protein